jgi:hypothetical protein
MKILKNLKIALASMVSMSVVSAFGVPRISVFAEYTTLDQVKDDYLEHLNGFQYSDEATKSVDEELSKKYSNPADVTWKETYDAYEELFQKKTGICRVASAHFKRAFDELKQKGVIEESEEMFIVLTGPEEHVVNLVKSEGKWYVVDFLNSVFMQGIEDYLAQNKGKIIDLKVKTYLDEKYNSFDLRDIRDFLPEESQFFDEHLAAAQFDKNAALDRVRLEYIQYLSEGGEYDHAEDISAALTREGINNAIIEISIEGEDKPRKVNLYEICSTIFVVDFKDAESLISGLSEILPPEFIEGLKKSSFETPGQLYFSQQNKKTNIDLKDNKKAAELLVKIWPK